MDFAPLIQARKVLAPLWKKAMLKGRCWGPRNGNNPYGASNITLAIGEELVSISQKPDGTLIIHEFAKAEETLLGTMVKEILRRQGLVSNTEPQR